MSKELRHGTSAPRVTDVIDGYQDLFGVRYTNRPNLSATLTDDKRYAAICAGMASVDDSLRTGLEPIPVVLLFDLPEDIIICEGPIAKGSAQGFSTNLEARVDDIPDSYFNALGILRKQAWADEASGKVTFYRVPREYFKYFD